MWKKGIKSVEMSGKNYEPTPTIIKKGQWLKEFGFEIWTKYQAECKEGKNNNHFNTKKD